MKLNLAHRALLIMALFSSCTENAIQLECVKQDTPTNNRTIEEILEIARNAPSTFESAATRSGQKTKEIDATSLKAIPGKSTRTGENINTSLYAINYADNDGFVIVSGNQATPGVIAYIEEGEYDIEEIQDSDSEIGFITDLATGYVANATLPLVPIPDPSQPDTIFRIVVDPLITTKWGQDNPEGLFCPNGKSGCFNTAVAQLMAYYEYPDTLQLTYWEADKDMIILNWDDMKRHKIRHTAPGHDNVSVPCLDLRDSHNNISYLCRQLGDLFLSDYLFSPDTITATGDREVQQNISQLGYEVPHDWLWYNDSCTVDPLLRRHPLLVSGFRIVGVNDFGENDYSGHVWLVDGVRRFDIRRTYFYADGATVTEVERQIYNHVNWGADGRSNGHILSSIFDQNRMYQLDPSIYGPLTTPYNYTHEIKYLEVYPDN